MAVILIVNPGSTSRKYALYKDSVCLVCVVFEILQEAYIMITTQNGVKISEESVTETEFESSVEKVLKYLVSQKYVSNASDITVVGLRVVAPGTYFTTHKIINAQYIENLKEKESVAPLHIPELLSEIHTITKILPDVILCGISDSAFHSTIPEYISTISIPKTDAKTYDIKRFGYHGLSYSSISRRLEQKFEIIPSRVIVCHIGGGVSTVALKDGVSVNTSMGYSPVSGMIMGSRGGDVSADVVTALTIVKKSKSKFLYKYLYLKSGFKGIAGVSDFRELLERKAMCNADAQLAIDMFVHQIQSWIGMHATQLDGVDVIILTASASERNPHIRKLVLSNLSLLGIEIDYNKNDTLVGKEGFIHSKKSKVKILVLKTDEIREIERESNLIYKKHR